jgi:hypothetical protein
MAYDRIAIIIRAATYKFIADRARQKDIQFGSLKLPKERIAIYVRKDDYKRMLKVARRFDGFVEQD